MGSHRQAPTPHPTGFQTARKLQARVDELEDELVEVAAELMVQRARAERLEARVQELEATPALRAAQRWGLETGPAAPRCGRETHAANRADRKGA